jgi:probable F420-dependent oxidoreductase
VSATGTRTVQVSITISGLGRLFGDDLGRVLDFARAADDAGIDQLLMTDHVIIGPRTDRYPFGRFPYGPEEPWPEPLTTLAAIAGATSRVRLGTGVLVAPLRAPVLLAKTVATLDALSRGRVDLGVGTGWQQEEFDALGVPFRGRGARLDDAIRACRALWTDEPPVSFTSPTVSFRDVWCEPRPGQPGGVPIWFGGAATGATARRIATLGSGWMPVGVMPVDALAAGIDMIRGAFVDAGRDPATLGVRAGLPAVVGDDGRLDVEATWAPAPQLAAVGVTAASLALGRGIRRYDDIPRFLVELGAAARELG